MIGSTIRHYAIDGRLGEGGMGTVYRARDTVLQRTVAIKVLTATDPESALPEVVDADAVFGYMTEEMSRAAKQLCWVQAMSAVV